MNIHRPQSARKKQHGIHIDSRGQDQPVDKSRAQQASVGEGCPEEKAHCDAATPPWDAPGGVNSAGSIPIDHLINQSISSCTPFLTRGIRHDSIRHEAR
jgi:hypothetical protein